MITWVSKLQKSFSKDQKQPVKDGVWIKCDACGNILINKELIENLKVCSNCGYLFRYSADEYFKLLLDDDKWEEFDEQLTSKDILEFKDSQKYSDRITKSIKSSTLNDAIRCVKGALDGRPVQLAVMDFSFMGGSVASVVGEKLVRAIKRAIGEKSPLIIVSVSGGMRMQEGVVSLMQMAKVSAALTLLSGVPCPFISIITNPTTGGTTASFSMLGDVIIAEPKALIGFAGPRVIKQTIGQDLPEGFQSSEFLLEKGFLDAIVERKQLKDFASKTLKLLSPSAKEVNKQKNNKRK